MNDKQVGVVRQRRSRREVDELVAEYETSGLSCIDFCRKRGLALSTLGRYRKRREQARREPAGGGQLLAVELSGVAPAAVAAAGSSLAVVLPRGRRIEVGRGFDAATLEQLVRVLEQV